MRLQNTLLTMLAAIVLSATGCVPGVLSPLTGQTVLPPAHRLMGPGPGVTGPGPGVLSLPPQMRPAPEIKSSQFAFRNPEGLLVYWDTSAPGKFDTNRMAPFRYNFPQSAIYRLKLAEIPGRPGVELYPTLEVAPVRPRSEAYLDHNAIPIQLTEEDFDHVLSGNFVTKVIYLPDPKFQELALADVDVLISTRLDPGQDPVVEADRRGTILAILRLGNKDKGIPESDNDAAQGENGKQAFYHPGAMPVSFQRSVLVNNGAAPTGVLAPSGQPSALPPSFVSGLTVPPWGMASSGTPLGLPGPPHLPFGSPAGLQRHIIRNGSHAYLPQPTQKINMHVKRYPSYSYPKPPNRVDIVERTQRPSAGFRQTLANMFKWVK